MVHLDLILTFSRFRVSEVFSTGEILLDTDCIDGNMMITSVKEKELYKVRTPIFYNRSAENRGRRTKRTEQALMSRPKIKNSRNEDCRGTRR